VFLVTSIKWKSDGRNKLICFKAVYFQKVAIEDEYFGHHEMKWLVPESVKRRVDNCLVVCV
jgi:hypothetical protein